MIWKNFGPSPYPETRCMVDILRIDTVYCKYFGFNVTILVQNGVLPHKGAYFFPLYYRRAYTLNY